MIAGIYALASLEGAPLDEAAAATLGLGSNDSGVHRLEDCLVRLVDPLPASVDVSARPGDFCAMLGYLDEADYVADLLGMAHDTPRAALARAALDRWGDGAAAWLDGNWAIVRWEAPARRLTLASSMLGRDLICHAVGPARIAIAPDVGRLRRLPWVDGGLDPRGVLLSVGRARVRRAHDGETIVKSVRRLMPGERLVFGPAGMSSRGRATLRPAEPWHGDFGEAVAAADALMRRIMRGHLERHGDVALQLSGGLDSTLFALYAAEERRPGQRLIALSSAASPGSDLPDETGIARIAADALGMPLQKVWPADRSDTMLPSTQTFGAASGIPVNMYHTLSAAFENAAVAFGADALIGGDAGELSVTGSPPFAGGPNWRRWLRPAVHALRDRHAERKQDASPVEAFHIWLAPALAGSMDGDMREAWRRPMTSTPVNRTGQRWGVSPGWSKQFYASGAGNHAGLRYLAPFIDYRLLRLFANMPADFLGHADQTRRIARALMAGRIPDAVRLRTRGMPYSPDHRQRVRRDAGPALARISVYRANRLDEWLDLDRLEASLRDIAGGALPAQSWQDREAQMTACAAEFLLWFTTR